MTIHELAQLAGVSISTVSKVMNNRDAGISSETKQRIQQLAKQHHYVPYGIKTGDRPSHLIGILMSQGTNYALLTGILQQIRNRGYSAIVCNCSTASEETQNLAVLLSHNVDGVLWIRGNESTEKKQLFEDCQIPYMVLDENATEGTDAFFSFSRLSYEATQKLVEAGHRKIACVFSGDTTVSWHVCEGVKKCLLEHEIQPESDSFISADNCDVAWLQAYTALICLDYEAMSAISELANGVNLRIPEDLSIITFCQEAWKIGGVSITRLKKPYEEFGVYAADVIVDRIERIKDIPQFQNHVTFDAFDSVTSPPVRMKQLVVIGAANIDTLISVDKPLEVGKTIAIKHRSIMPGGKGLNQAVGVAKLGGAVRMLASLGRDYDGHRIMDYLHENRVGTDAFLIHDNTPTGHAYIYIQENAESSISVYDGANGLLCADDLEQNQHLFDGASYCLLQTEIDQGVALHAARLAKRHGVKVILKPCVVDVLDQEWSELADILVPNRKEAGKLLPGYDTPESQIAEFSRRGYQTVIVKCGEDGCYLLCNGEVFSFPAVALMPVDTTGAADAFIAALAVYLTQGETIERAIQYATCAAGLSTTRYGVPPALVNREELEIYYSEHQNEIQGVKL